MHTGVNRIVFLLVLDLEVRHALFQNWEDMPVICFRYQSDVAAEYIERDNDVLLLDSVVKGEMV